MTRATPPPFSALTLGDTNVTSLFATGKNVVTVQLKDKCGGTESSTAVWVLVTQTT